MYSVMLSVANKPFTLNAVAPKVGPVLSLHMYYRECLTGYLNLKASTLNVSFESITSSYNKKLVDVTISYKTRRLYYKTCYGLNYP
jgi:hypothetical protein